MAKKQSKTIELTTWQAVTVRDIVGSQQGDFKRAHRALAVLTALEFDDGYAAEIDYHETRLPNGTSQVRWNMEKEIPFKMTIKNGRVFEFLQNELKAFTKWPMIQAAEIVDLFDKFEIEFEDDGD